MARNRKRVFALPRAPDGSAFQKCGLCGESVPIAISDMHVCKKKKQQLKQSKSPKRLNKSQSHINNQSNVDDDDEEEEEVLKCKLEKTLKRAQVWNQSLDKEKLSNQPRSPFCIFMESFEEKHKDENQFDVGGRGFDIWKNMTTKERQEFVLEAERINMAYEQALLDEIEDAMVDDEADSIMVGKFDVNYAHWYNSESS